MTAYGLGVYGLSDSEGLSGASIGATATLGITATRLTSENAYGHLIYGLETYGCIDVDTGPTPAQATLGSSSTLSILAEGIKLGIVDLSGTAIVDVTPVYVAGAASVLSSITTVSIVGIANEVLGALALSSQATIGQIGSRLRSSPLTLVSDGTLSISPVRSLSAQIDLQSTGLLDVVASRTTTSGADLSATSSISGVPSAIRELSSVLSVLSTQGISGSPVFTSSVGMGTTGSLSVSATGNLISSLGLDGSAAVLATPNYIGVSGGTLSAIASLDGSPVQLAGGVLDLNGSATLNSLASPTLTSSTTLSSQGSFGFAGSRIFRSAASFSGEADLIPAGVADKVSGTTLSSILALAITSANVKNTSLGLGSTLTLAASYVVERAGVLGLEGSADLTALVLPGIDEGKISFTSNVNILVTANAPVWFKESLIAKYDVDTFTIIQPDAEVTEIMQELNSSTLERQEVESSTIKEFREL